MSGKKMDISKIDDDDFKVIHDGLKILKDRHYYSEVYTQIENYKFSNKQKVKLFRLKAECKYQNKELASKVRFQDALDLLSELEEDAETLSLKGAVLKRKYFLDKDIQDIYMAISYYEKASKFKLSHKDASTVYDDEQGYGSVNTIYLYKVLLNVLDNTLDEELKDCYKNKITSLIDKTLKHIDKYKGLFKDNPYLNPTIAELYFANSLYDDAQKYLDKSYIKNEENERLENLVTSKYITPEIREIVQKSKDKETIISRSKLTTIEQFTALYKLNHKDEEAERSIKFLVEKFKKFVSNGNDVSEHISNVIPLKNIIASSYYEKMGIALSGGGFRASLFHIGVFARLAELNMLRHVEVISSVSGGSIVAMQYYLMLKKLLESKINSDIKQKDYIDLVKKLEEIFLGVMKKNLRMLAFESFDAKSQSVTQRIGELYQEEIYNESYNWIGEKKSVPQKMHELLIHPKLSDDVIEKNFKPHFNNIEIDNKVPILVINATCLNNGHNWRFTASGMGESQYMYDTTIDKNTIYPYNTYEYFTKNNTSSVTIADAVASSSGVPVLFDPIEFGDLYENGENIKLVDGGMYDNQGLASIVDEECKLIVCSDASGLFSDKKDPSSCRLSVLPRTNDALMDRVRDLEYEIVKEMLESKKISGLCILHLKQCFEPVKIELDNKSKSEYSEMEKIIYDKKLFSKDIQEKLSKVRTDLDSFHDMESYSLMYSGYNMMTKWFEYIKDEQGVWTSFDSTNNLNCKNEKYSFFEIERVLQMANEKEKLLNTLEVSKKIFFKVSLLQVPKIQLFIAMSVLIIYSLALFCISIYIPILTWLCIFIGLLALLLGLIVFAIKLKIFSSYSFVKKVTKPVLSLVARFNLKYLNKKYLKSGEITNEL